MLTKKLGSINFSAKYNDRFGNVIVSYDRGAISYTVFDTVFSTFKSAGYKVRPRYGDFKFTVYDINLDTFGKFFDEAVKLYAVEEEKEKVREAAYEAKYNSPGIYEVYQYSDPNLGWGNAGTVTFVKAENVSDAATKSGYRGMGYGIVRLSDAEYTSTLTELKNNIKHYTNLFNALNSIVK